MTETNIENSDPQWILDQRNDGVLYWRRENGETRVTFLHAVEVLEFEREEQENEVYRRIGSSLIGISLSCIACVLITAILPWYLVIGS
ncbi:uncharacterized protein LOC123322844 [Coccinella septempunctata]|uniref:uncharacterized protein LOC123322844 n=1 Tax=Coccinella septempunctata TaxID=41139 RepID=UPI001D097DDC|nr:uncharacterized protein LOC123322844 [Coccinella septempunctata]